MTRSRVLIALLIQLVGAGVCLAVAWPWLGPATAGTPGRSPTLGQAADLSDDARLPSDLGLPAGTLNRLEVARASARVELVATGLSWPFEWRELGLRLVEADDADAAAALARSGLRLQTARLALPAADTDTADDAGTSVDVLTGLHVDTVRRAVTRIADHIDRAPIAARWDFANERPLGDVPGREVDVLASADRLFDAATRPELPSRIELVVEERPARVRRTPDLDGAAPRELLATFSTRYDTGNRARVTNLRLAARAIDGLVLMPGQSFSYNETVGERSLERGFEEAPVIVHGEIVEGVGGGACQVSSTLHAASLFGGLEVVERQNHSLPSSYIEKGLDAVVAWPLLDLKLRNPYPFPIFLRIYLDDGRVRAKIYGSKKGHRVVVRREVHEPIPFEEQVQVDETLEEGVVRVDRQGKIGYRVFKGRMIWKDGKEEFERLPNDVYQPRAKKVRVGPNTEYPPEDPAAPN